MLSERQLSDKVSSKKDAVEDAVDALRAAVDDFDFDRSARVSSADFEAVNAIAAAAQEVSVLLNELGCLKNVARSGQAAVANANSDGRYRRYRG